MPDRRSVDDLSIEELEEILRMKKREARLERLRTFEEQGRRTSGAPITSDYEVRLPSGGTQRFEHESLTVEQELSEQNIEETQRKRTFRDNLLLAVELLAALGIVAILGIVAFRMAEINRLSAEEQAAELAALPTPTVTPIISVVVLPGGHTR